jgi:hypothetical protein
MLVVNLAIPVEPPAPRLPRAPEFPGRIRLCIFYGKICQVIPIREISMNTELDKSLTFGITAPSSLKELDFHLTAC